ncbi:leukocyte receptor cluster member 1-like [Tropilaelaps mercedesae]|uniref:Leukocyte receptor cluster member 1-like n=1 Tax=Tropilaelaps mercedesae TaxID=418985 RepID=A0A1V9XBC3_9ACAR|nr:leukocyte receptor cluster member 1-like [Tropilaelaps mercedesae]
MNILPKKSWHVRTKKNIERVRRDEAEAAAKEKELSKRAQVANLEASLDILRKRNGATGHDDADRLNGVGTSSPCGGDVCGEGNSNEGRPPTKSLDLINPSGSSGSGHLNLFRDLELAEGKLHGANPEAEAERKREQEDWEKRVGILQYLGQGSTNAEGSERFYQKLSSRTIGAPTDSSTANLTAEAIAGKKRDDRQKIAEDPLRTIHKYLWAKKTDVASPSSPRASSSYASTTATAGSSGSSVASIDKRQRQADLRRIEILPEGVSNVKRKIVSPAGDKRRRPSISSSSTDDEYSRRQRKRKKAKKSKRRRTPSSESDPESEEERRNRKRSNLDLLRRQRLEREERESRRTREYLASLVDKVGDTGGGAKASHSEAGGGGDDRSRKYNSQYNPHLSRF